MKKLISVFLALAVLVFSGCTASYMEKTQGDAISPVQDSEFSSSSAVMPLYFRYYNEPVLLRCPLNIETTQHEQDEYYAISALITESLGQRPEISYCFKGETKLVSVKSEGDYLYVTLSEDFYNDTKTLDGEETRLNRKLAIYSIVNTVCEMGNHSYVQIYVEKSGTALRPDAYEMGIAKTPENSTPLGPLSRDTSLILTPSNVAKQGLKHYSNLEWDKLYLYLGQKDGEQVKMPLLEELKQKLNYLSLTMTEAEVEENYTVSEDNKSAFVQVSFKIRTENSSYTVSGKSLEMIYKDRAWVISYSSLMKALEVEA